MLTNFPVRDEEMYRDMSSLHHQGQMAENGTSNNWQWVVQRLELDLFKYNFSPL